MGDPLDHSKSSASKHGGTVDDYMWFHMILDSSKYHLGDWRHRALMHTTFGVHLMETHIVGPLFRRESDGEPVCTRTLATEHILEDMGVLLTPADFLREMPIAPWMAGVWGTSDKKRARTISLAGGTEPPITREYVVWRDAKEEMPEKSGLYLVNYADGTTLPTYYVDAQKGFLTRARTSVMYWAHMPLGPVDTAHPVPEDVETEKDEPPSQASQR